MKDVEIADRQRRRRQGGSERSILNGSANARRVRRRPALVAWTLVAAALVSLLLTTWSYFRAADQLAGHRAEEKYQQFIQRRNEALVYGLLAPDEGALWPASGHSNLCPLTGAKNGISRRSGFPAAPIVGVFSGGSSFRAVPASKVILVLSANGDSQPARAAHDYAVALNTFLDLNASPNGPQTTGVQGSGTNLNAAGPPRSPSADVYTRAELLVPEAYVQRLETQSGDGQQGPETLPLSSQADEGLTPVPSEIRAESADRRAVSDGSVETRDGGKWTYVINVFLVVSIPMMWTCWVSRPIWSRQSTPA